MRTTYANLVLTDAALLAPGITRWHRLEADPTALDLEPGLAARIADPLWLVGRQWQLGELRGEDAGTPIQAFLSGSAARLRLRGTDASADAADALWEPLVEAEAEPLAAWATLAAEAGIDLEQALVEVGAGALVPAVRAAFPLVLEGRPLADRQEVLLAELCRGSAIDGAALLAALRGIVGPSGAPPGLPEAIAVPADLSDAARIATQGWFADWNDFFVLAPAQAWNDRRLEYAFDIDTDAEGGASLHVEGYADGRLDWWSMDHGGASPGPSAASRQVSGVRIPVPVRYAGMPANRYFEFEDSAVNLAAVSAGPTAIATMVLLEYALAAGTDWFHLPLTLDYGHSFTVETLRVTDTFGRVAEIGRAGQGPAGWCMFEVSMQDDPALSEARFVLPAVVAQTIEGAPLEEVAFFRDEMANLVWATERVVPGFGATALSRLQDARVVHQTLDTAGLTDAAFVYRMQTPVPLNWHPMVAVRDPERPLGTVLFRRTDLRRTILIDGVPAEIDGTPRSVLLRGRDGVFEVEEAEIARTGVVITRSFQMARTADGRRLLWLGRTRRAGTGEGSSGLRFDVLAPVEDAG